MCLSKSYFWKYQTKPLLLLSFFFFPPQADNMPDHLILRGSCLVSSCVITLAKLFYPK